MTFGLIAIMVNLKNCGMSCNNYIRVRGAELEFISVIRRDGSGTRKIVKTEVKHLENDMFTLLRLSISEDTYLAHGFNSYVVRRKPVTGLKSFLGLSRNNSKRYTDIWKKYKGHLNK
jgi:hypothetical protein